MQDEIGIKLEVRDFHGSTKLDVFLVSLPIVKVSSPGIS